MSRLSGFVVSVCHSCYAVFYVYKVAASVRLCVCSGFRKNVRTDFHETFT